MRLFGLLLTILMIISINPVVSNSSENLEYGVYTSVTSDYAISRHLGENLSHYGFIIRTEVWNYQTSNVSVVNPCNELSLEVEGEIEDYVDVISGDVMDLINICTDDVRTQSEVIEPGELKEIFAVVGMTLVGNQSILPLGNYTFSFTNVDDIDNELIFPFNLTVLVKHNNTFHTIKDPLIDNFGELDPFDIDDNDHSEKIGETTEDTSIFITINLISSLMVLSLLMINKKNKNT